MPSATEGQREIVSGNEGAISSAQGGTTVFRDFSVERKTNLPVTRAERERERERLRERLEGTQRPTARLQRRSMVLHVASPMQVVFARLICVDRHVRDWSLALRPPQ